MIQKSKKNSQLPKTIKKTPSRHKKKEAKSEVKKPKMKEKKAVISQPKKEIVRSKPEKKTKYYEAVGRRKTAVARVRLYTSNPSESVLEGNLTINNKPYKEIFPSLELQNIIESSLKRLKALNRFRATIKVKGGGLKGQAEAIRHGLARTLVLFDSNFRKKLKKEGYLTRDPRKKERKKFGLKKARRAPQWSKR